MGDWGFVSPYRPSGGSGVGAVLPALCRRRGGGGGGGGGCARVCAPRFSAHGQRFSTLPFSVRGNRRGGILGGAGPVLAAPAAAGVPHSSGHHHPGPGTGVLCISLRLLLSPSSALVRVLIVSRGNYETACAGLSGVDTRCARLLSS